MSTRHDPIDPSFDVSFFAFLAPDQDYSRPDSLKKLDSGEEGFEHGGGTRLQIPSGNILRGIIFPAPCGTSPATPPTWLTEKPLIGS
jgi:hypothetical protein